MTKIETESALAQVIRTVDGNHNLGAGELAHQITASDWFFKETEMHLSSARIEARQQERIKILTFLKEQQDMYAGWIPGLGLADDADAMMVGAANNLNFLIEEITKLP